MSDILNQRRSGRDITVVGGSVVNRIWFRDKDGNKDSFRGARENIVIYPSPLAFPNLSLAIGEITTEYFECTVDTTGVIYYEAVYTQNTTK